MRNWKDSYFSKTASLTSTRGQEEIAGFVVVVVIVTIVLLIFLSLLFSMRSSSNATKSQELSNFLTAVKSYTTNCTLFGNEYASIKDTLLYCYKRNTCLSRESPCKIANATINSILLSTKSFGENASLKGYKFRVYHNSSTGAGSEEIMLISRGNCTSNYFYTQDFIIESPSSSGLIYLYYQECY